MKLKGTIFSTEMRAGRMKRVPRWIYLRCLFKHKKKDMPRNDEKDVYIHFAAAGSKVSYLLM